jgi:hypothetical protein
MGHVHLGVLPAATRWKTVVSLLDTGAPDEVVVAASGAAAETQLIKAAEDPVYVEAVRLLMMIPLCARADDFGQALRDADIPVGHDPDVFDLVGAVTRRLGAVAAASTGRSDLGELAGRALASTLSVGIGDQLPGLFEATPADVQAAARKMSWNKGIAGWTRLFYARLVAGSLSYWLDRTLAEHVGPDARFADAGRRGAFDAAVLHHARGATRIIEEFSGGWYGKTVHAQGRIGTAEAKVFGAIALKKIVAELRVRRDAHD